MQDGHVAIGAIVGNLLSADERVLLSSLSDAYLVLEQSSKRSATSRELRELERTGDAPPEEKERRLSRLRDQYRRSLPEEYLDLDLTDQETDAITGVLLQLLGSPTPVVATSAAGALGACGRLYAVPSLAALVRRYAAISRDTAVTAIRSLSEVLISVDPKRTLWPAEDQIVAEALRALQFAATADAEQFRDVRKYALGDLSWATRHVGRAS